MYRIVTEKLIKWKNSSRRKPLIVRGARQVGKTWAIEKFGSENYAKFYTIDLEKRPDIHSVFDGNLDPKVIIEQLESLLNIRINIDNTLVFFDEIQACPKALSALRYFYEEMPELHIIAAGSLLEFALSKISFPVGRVQFLNMYPCTFYEFLCAVDKNIIASKLLEPITKLPEAIHNALLAEMRNYFFIGGMPEAIAAYIGSGSMLDAFDVQTEIVDAYRQDFSKYAPRVDKQCLNMVLNSVSEMVGEQIKYSRLAEGFSNPTMHKAFDLLENARVIRKIRSISHVGFPLGIGCSDKRFKAAVLDIGLMQKLAHVAISSELRHTDLLAMFRGKLAEQFVAQELLASQDGDIFYWSKGNRSGAAEVDFVIERNNEIMPIEVKSGKGGSLRSMHIMLNNYDICQKGIVFYSGSFAECQEQNLVFVPLYYAGTL